MPQIIKKHTHTRTIYKHHFVKPKTGKSLLNASPILQSIGSSPASIKVSGANLLKPLPPLSESESIALGFGKNVWRPSASEYRASELNYVPKKMKIPKKKNPFKMLEVMAEAHAEGHEIPAHIMKKLKPSLLDNIENSDSSSEYIPEYMLANSDLYNADDNSASDSDSSKSADLIYVAPQSDKYKAKKPSYLPSKVLLTPTLATLTLKGKKPKMSYDWMPGTISTSLSSTSSTSSDSRASSDSDDESEIKHTLSQLLKRNKSRKPKRLYTPAHSRVHSPSEDHFNILQMTRKPFSITNFTKYKNRLSAAASTLNTSI